jgi:hypothetical protein
MMRVVDGAVSDRRPELGDLLEASSPSLLQIDEHDPAPTYIQLERRIRVAVADGSLKPGEALPPNVGIVLAKLATARRCLSSFTLASRRTAGSLLTTRTRRG